MDNWLNRTEILIGKENMQKLQSSNVIVFGLGGVGSYVVEGLIRSGIENIAIIDKIILIPLFIKPFLNIPSICL